MRSSVARRSGVRRRSVSTLVAPMRRRSCIRCERRGVAHGHAVDIGHRQREAGALQQRAEIAQIGERRDARRDAAVDLGSRLRRTPGAIRSGVSPPSSAARNSPSGFSARRIWISVPGRSLTNCSASADTTRSSEPARTAALLVVGAIAIGEAITHDADAGQRAAHRIARRAEIGRALELAQHRGEPLGHVLGDAVEQKRRRPELAARARRAAQQRAVEDERGLRHCARAPRLRHPSSRSSDGRGHNRAMQPARRSDDRMQPCTAG